MASSTTTLVLNYKSGKTVEFVVENFKVTYNKHNGDLTGLTWTPPEKSKIRLLHVGINDIESIWEKVG